MDQIEFMNVLKTFVLLNGGILRRLLMTSKIKQVYTQILTADTVHSTNIIAYD